MSGPRPLPDPVPVAWFQVVVTLLVAGFVGGGVAWLLARRWGP